ncbi:MAG: inositol monophosphatase [Patescibacteria group bacterium]|nr:inositol monophosphatase [Patescibacteria group bacterium]MDD5715559.1 inositol monophosphatase [Patescibacteria group bacterium]
MEYIKFITGLLKQASVIAVKNFGHVTSSIKPTDRNQVLTEIDLEIGKFLVTKIRQAYPAYNIIDEESSVVDRNSEYTWVLDPIDGTSNYAAGSPLYGIMIGLLKKAIPIAGGVSLPHLQSTYAAEKGKGAFRNGNTIHVTAESSLSNVLMAYGIDPHPDNPSFTKKEMDIMHQVVLRSRNLRISNSVCDAMMVADGTYGGWMCQSSKIWDCVAMQVIVEEAGGIFTDVSGMVTDYSNPLTRTSQNFTQCAAAPAIHRQLLEICHPIP